MKVRDNTDQLINAVFAPWERQILEFTLELQPEKRINVKDQFLYYYKKSCYNGTLDELITAMIIKKQDNIYLLHQLQDLITNIRKIIDINEYNKVIREYTDKLASEGGVRATGSKNQNQSQTTDQILGKDRTINSSIDLTETGTSQTNKLEEIGTVIKRPSETTTEDKTTLTLQNEEKPIHYQNFSIDQTLNKNFNNTDTSTNQNTNSTGTSDSLSSSTDARATKSDESKITVEYLTNDNRIKMWRLEIPKLRRKFWQIFHNIFTYEQW